MPTLDGVTAPWSHEFMENASPADLIGPGILFSGLPLIHKNSALAKTIWSRSAVVLGARTRTSLASLSFRSLLGPVGGSASKAVPYIGWAWTVNDLLKLTVPSYDEFLDKQRKINAEYGGPNMGGKAGMYVCFAGGTKVYAEEGLTNIEGLKEGIKVYSYNLETEQLELKPIVRFFKRDVQEVYSIIVRKEEIIVTSEHPFYVESKGWVKVKDLQEKDLLLTLKGKTKEISKISKAADAIAVYNIEVEGNHNYFVGKTKVLVHNK